MPERLLSEHAGIYGGFKPKTYPAVVGLEGEQTAVSRKLGAACSIRQLLEVAL